ncbi:CU044_5270 family protein [Streptomyces sp. 71268]|uniref:CU044_5270 family protein n=1 Tax=Streptomyces sp. 71268 TaxID=3002640 RepID=UPI0023F6248D|nr:CU044_5270 family protein [Streptomyces sp. 71268]WEV26114.1 CU044_5270 family protein [Streptomyces sp. 71268]
MRARWRTRGAGADTLTDPEPEPTPCEPEPAPGEPTDSGPAPTDSDSTSVDSGPAPADSGPAPIEPTGPTAPEAVARSPLRARLAWLFGPAVAGPVVAVAMVAQVISTIAPSLDGKDGHQLGRPRHIAGPPASSTYAPGAHGGGDERDGAPELLARAARAAERDRGFRPRDGEFTYVRSRSAVAADSSDESVCTFVEPLRQRQIWRSVDGSRAGLLRSEQYPGERIRLDPEAPGPTSTAFRHLQRLPRDPAALLRALYAAEPAGRSDDQEVFRAVGGMLAETVLPPATEAALYRAAARIPDVVVIRDAVDAVGRRGVAVARVDDVTGERDEWLFDRDSLRLLGVRVVLVDPEKAPGAARENCDKPKAGAVTSTTAVVARGVVARPGDQPRADRAPAGP